MYKMDFEIITDTVSCDIKTNQTKHTSSGQQIKRKENEKKDKYLDLDWKLKEQWKMKKMVISIKVSALGTLHKDLANRLKELVIRGKTESILTREMLRSSKIFTKFLETWWDLQSHSNEKITG